MPPRTKFASPPSASMQNIFPLSAQTHTQSPHEAPYMDLSRSAVYQVDYTCVNVGKTVGATKRRIRWRFGFANPDAIEAEKVGPECRGEEHEIILNWSLTSGKRSLIVDGNALFDECRPLETTVEFMWEMRGGNVFKVKGSVKPKMWKDDNERQFDLLLNGKPFADFTQIFELGRTGTRSNSRKTLDTSAPKTRTVQLPESEKVDWPSQKHYDRQYTPATVSSEQSAFDFASYNNPASPVNAAPAPTFDQIWEASHPAPPVFAAPSAPAPAGAPPAPLAPAFTYAPAPVAPTFQPEYYTQDRHAMMNQQVMEAYQTAAITAPPTNNDPTVPAPESEAPTPLSVFEGEETYIAPRLQIEDEKPDPSNVDYLMKKLCNLEDITSDPHTQKLTLMEPPSTSEPKKQDGTKSRPIAPIKVSYVGAEPSLSQIKHIAAASNAPIPSTSKNVMKAPPQPSAHNPGVAHGAMVLHASNANSNHWNVAPPIQRPVGFGVGAHLGQGYGEYTSNQGISQGVYANM